MTRSIPVKASRPHVRQIRTHCPLLLWELRINVDVERAVEAALLLLIAELVAEKVAFLDSFGSVA
jgi:hypothetical protein